MRHTAALLSALAIAAAAPATPPPSGGTTTTGSGPQASARPPQRPMLKATSGSVKRDRQAKPTATNPGSNPKA